MSRLRLRSGFSRRQQWLMLIYSDLIKKPLLSLIQRIMSVRQVNQTIGHDSADRRLVRRVQEPTFVPLQSASLECVASSRVTAEIQQSVLPEPPALMGLESSYRQAESSVDQVTIEPSDKADSEPLLVLYVMAHQQDRLYGEPLLRSLLQLGFRYGERAVFHRHLNPLASGPILFSVVNMVKPGTFNPSSMSEFTTPGVALCMTIPAYGDTLQNFKLMLQAAQRLADGVSGVVLDSDRHLLTLETRKQYTARIRRLLAEAS